MKKSLKVTQLLAAIALSIAFSLVSHASEEVQTKTYDGLVLKKSDTFDYVYAKPDLDISGYDSIIVQQGDVRFKKNWARDYRRDTGYRVRDKDLAKMKTSAASLLEEVFKDTIKENAVMKLVEEPKETALIVKASLIDLDVNAPDIDRKSRTDRYVHSAGEGTLYLEVFDSVSGDLLARVIDHDKARDYTYLRRANLVTNKSEARTVFRGWTKRLHEQLVKTKELHSK